MAVHIPDLAPNWLPEVGDKLTGTIVELKWNEHGKFGRYPIIIVADTDGKPWAVHAATTALMSKLMELKPKVGEEIALRYDGLKQSKSKDAEYHSYEVAMDRPGAEFEWDETPTGPGF